MKKYLFNEKKYGVLDLTKRGKLWQSMHAILQFQIYKDADKAKKLFKNAV